VVIAHMLAKKSNPVSCDSPRMALASGRQYAGTRLHTIVPPSRYPWCREMYLGLCACVRV